MRKFYRYIKKYLARWLDRQIDRLDIGLSWAQGLRGPILRTVSSQFIYEFRRLVLLLRKGLTFRVYRLSGAVAGSGQPLRILFVTESRAPEYLQTRFFQEGTVQRDMLGEIPFWKVAAACRAARKEVDLVLVERNSLLDWTPDSGHWLVVPAWVRMVFEFEKEETWDDRLKKLRGQERNIRKIKRTEISYRISHSEEDFDLFYERMYVPSVEERHGAAGIVNRRQKLHEAFQRGMLMFAENSEGEIIAGKLAEVNGGLYLGVSNGVLDGQAEYREAGGVSALYYYSIQWAFENQIRQYDIGEVRPFLDDGIYLHKKRWGFEPVPDLWVIREWLFWIQDESPVALEWLHSQPFLPGFTYSNIREEDRLFAGTGA